MTSSNQAGSSDEHIFARCPNCQKKLRVPKRMAGRQAKCPQCAHTLTLPGASPRVAKASAPVRQAAPARKAAAPVRKASAPVQVQKMWHVHTEEGEEYGPIDRAELDEWHAEGRLAAECLLYCDGDADWQRAADVFPDLDAPQPVVSESPATSDNPFDFGGGDAGVARSRTSRSSSSRQGGGRLKRGEKAPKSGLVTTVAVLEYIMGAMNLLGGIVLSLIGFAAVRLTSGGGLSPEEAAADPESAAIVGAIILMARVTLAMGIVVLLSGVISIAAGVGVQMRANWGRILSLILAGILGVSVLASLGLSLNFGDMTLLISAIPNMAYVVFIFVVLLNKKAAREFG